MLRRRIIVLKANAGTVRFQTRFAVFLGIERRLKRARTTRKAWNDTPSGSIITQLAAGVVRTDSIWEMSAKNSSDLLLEDAEDPDSAANYMKGLLARSRREYDPDSSDGPRPDLTVNAPKPAPQPAKAAPLTEGPMADTVRGGSSTISEDGVNYEAVPLESLAPKHQQDRDAVRADLALMRRVANRSARTAIATSTWKRLRGKLFVKSVLAVVSLTIATVLLTGKLWGTVSYSSFGWASLAIGAITAVELINSTLLLHRLNSHASAEEARIPSSDDVDSDA